MFAVTVSDGGLSQQPSLCHPFTVGVSGASPAILSDSPVFFSPIPERPVSFSPPPMAPPKGYSGQRRKSTSVLEAHTRHFAPAFPRYGGGLRPFLGLEDLPPLYVVREPGVYEEAARRRSLNQAALLDHYEAMAYGAYPVTPHALGLGFHQQRAAASLGYEPPQPGFIHAHLLQHLSQSHSPVPFSQSHGPAPQINPMSQSHGPVPFSQSHGPAPQINPMSPSHGPVPFSQSHGPAPPINPMGQSHGCAMGPSHSPVPQTHSMAPPSTLAPPPEACLDSAVFMDPLLASRVFRVRRSSMDLPLEDGAGSGSTYSRLQPVTEELYAYVSPELPLAPGSLLLHHHSAMLRDRSPEPSSDSLTSSDPGELQTPPPQFDSAQILLHAPYGTAPPTDTPPLCTELRPQGSSYTTELRPQGDFLELRPQGSSYTTELRPQGASMELRPQGSSYTTELRPQGAFMELRPQGSSYTTELRPQEAFMELCPQGVFMELRPQGSSCSQLESLLSSSTPHGDMTYHESELTPPMQAPPMQAPPMQAPPMQAPPMQAPPMVLVWTNDDSGSKQL